jgi:hypothetical protein
MYDALWENKFQWPGRTIARRSLYFVTAIRFCDRLSGYGGSTRLCGACNPRGRTSGTGGFTGSSR